MKRSTNSSRAPRVSRASSSAEKRGALLPHGTLLPEFIQPQLATLVSTVPEEAGWLHEFKFDGYRLLCRIDNRQVSLLTRNAQDWTSRFGVLRQAANQLSARRALIDGEIVAIDDDGAQNFQRLQNYLGDGGDTRLVYHAFDLLYLDGRDLRDEPLLERKHLLQRLLSRGAQGRSRRLIRYSKHWMGRGKKLLAQACEGGLEGVIAKRVDAPYRSGRSRSWLKIKCSKGQEFVIGGFTDPAGARVGFGALLLGVHDESGALRYAGRVGTGFSQSTLDDLYRRLEKHECRSTPFVNSPRGVSARRVHWVEPELVAEVVFTDWTSDGLLRHPSFRGLREDKPAGEISREMAAPAPPKLSQEVKNRRRDRGGN